MRLKHPQPSQSFQIVWLFALTCLYAWLMPGKAFGQARADANVIDPLTMTQALNAVRARGCAGFADPRAGNA